MIKNYKFLIVCFVFVLMVSFGLKIAFTQTEQNASQYILTCRVK